MGDASCAPNITARSFSSELFNAVRSDHTALNRHITSRLPLCLPPHTEQPLLYLKGLQVFGQIFEVFENRLAQQLERRASQGRDSDALRLIDLPGLHRTRRLRQDIEVLQLRLREQKLVPDENIESHARDLLEDTVDRLVERPHLILAHAWAMYLALFNGGRWIRTQLQSVGEEFWMGPPPLSFWEFDGEQDGDDVHVQFKKNFELAAQCLTAQEWMEVVREAREVFALCSRLVGMLDEIPEGKPRTKSGPTLEMRAGLDVRLRTTFIWVGVVCLLVAVWALLLRSTMIRHSSTLPAVAASYVSVR